MTRISEHDAIKVPAVTTGFWIIKILATTLGETGGDTVSMTWDLGYLVGSAIFLAALVVLIGIQIATKRFHPFLYWSVIVASTTAGTTMADFADRSLGIGYTGGSAVLFAILMAARSIERGAGAALGLVTQIRDNTNVIWNLQDTNRVAAQLLSGAKAILNDAGQIAQALHEADVRRRRASP